ncbi:26S proteasome regulatory subunit RPN10 [Saccharomyces cerevisiae S288c] [Rhizoctonia solani]|uniref:26S proteasome regulatory subunit RPN10 [Saccharomyces cerevisiae S288c] n=1 Tax=Rhizoctonia solani TaxID=456999 RepID=A0A0K6FW65_9AGAM|nr:26S proteasome regulatory subunit RPN10 [Saccharomyces cerevisiae S288c] [Rhizoctonia solani]
MLEATILLIDNSEYMRNGDYQPSRFGAQADAVNVVFTSKTDANPESTVGLMTLAGKAPEVLVTPTTNHGKILSALHQTKISGSVDLATGLNVAQLALKHRQNKNQRQRIVVFLGSPLDTDEKSLIRLAKKLKKNNVAVDVVSFGEEELNDPLLRVFVDTLNSSDNSHLLSIPSGANMLISDAILSSPILAGDDGVPPGGMGGEASGSNQFEFGVDPSLDPELAMALRISMEEERARQAAAAGTSGAVAPSLAQVPESVEPTSQVVQVTVPSMEEDEEDALLAQALALSQEQGDVAMESGESNEMDEDLNEEEEIARAIEMSVKEEEEQNKNKGK